MYVELLSLYIVARAGAIMEGDDYCEEKREKEKKRHKKGGVRPSTLLLVEWVESKWRSLFIHRLKLAERDLERPLFSFFLSLGA
jgi:hypothetical protein